MAESSRDMIGIACLLMALLLLMASPGSGPAPGPEGDLRPAIREAAKTIPSDARSVAPAVAKVYREVATKYRTLDGRIYEMAGELLAKRSEVIGSKADAWAPFNARLSGIVGQAMPERGTVAQMAVIYDQVADVLEGLR